MPFLSNVRNLSMEIMLWLQEVTQKCFSFLAFYTWLSLLGAPQKLRKASYNRYQETLCISETVKRNVEKKSKDWLLTGKLCPNTKTTEFVIHFAVLKLVFCKHNTWLSNCYYELLNNRPFLGFDNLTCMQPLRVSTSKENQEVNTTGPRKILIKDQKQKKDLLHARSVN